MNNAPVVLLTGASSGIGWETALVLAEEGCRLAVTARRVERLQELAGLCKERSGVEPLVMQADMRRREDIERMVKETVARFGRLDVLINNAGVLFMQEFTSMPLSDMQNLMDTNFWGPLHAVRAAAPFMKKQGGGHVINVGSGVSRRGLPYMAVYSATKFALAGLTESIRLELAPQNIRFTFVYPGSIETEMPAGVDRARLPANYPAHFPGIHPKRVAGEILWAVRKQPLEVYVPGWVRATSWLSVIWPSLADWVVKKIRMPKPALSGR